MVAEPGSGTAPPLAERELLEEAVVDLMVERGYEGMTVAAVAARAGLPPEAFGRHFADLDDAILQAFRRYRNEFNARLRAAFEREQSWRDSLRAAAYAAARYLRDNPRVARFGTIQMFEAGQMAQVERESQLHEMVDLIDAGRGELDDPDSIGRGVAEGVLGSVYGSLVREIKAGRGTRAAEDFVPELMYVAVRPYLGHEVAREELTIPAPPDRGAGAGGAAPR